MYHDMKKQMKLSQDEFKEYKKYTVSLEKTMKDLQYKSRYFTVEVLHITYSLMSRLQISQNLLQILEHCQFSNILDKNQRHIVFQAIRPIRRSLLSLRVCKSILN